MDMAQLIRKPAICTAAAVKIYMHHVEEELARGPPGFDRRERDRSLSHWRL